MKKVYKAIGVSKKHYKFILTYIVTLTSVTFICITETLFNREYSFGGYCITASVIILLWLIDKADKEAFNEGYELGRLDNEVFWEKEYSILIKRCENNGQILPVRINDDYKILSVEMVSKRQLYGTGWEIIGIYNKTFFSYILIRPDDETLMNLIRILIKTKCPVDITQLDKQEKIS